MKYMFQYESDTEREDLIEENKDKTLIEENNLLDRNFLVFSDDPENDTKQVIYVNVPEEDYNKINENTDYLLNVDFRLLVIEMEL